MLIAGFSAFSVAFLGARLIAPFYGLGPFLASVLIVVTFLAVALGVSLGGRGANAGSRALGLAMLGAGLWTLIALFSRRPLLLALEPAGLRIDVTLAAIVLIGPPLVMLGVALSRALVIALAASKQLGRTAAEVLGAFLFGVAIAAPLVPFVLLPRLGLSGATILVGAIQIVTGLLAISTKADRGAVPVVIVALLAGIATWAAPAGARGRLPAQVMALAESGSGEVRVVERSGSRYLIEDGSILGVVEPVSWVGLQRAEAALGLVNLIDTEPGRVLIAGLRGGSLPKRLFAAGWKVDVVEPDSAHARIARRYLGLLPGEALLLLSEPRDLLRRSRESYDLIVLDAFAEGLVRPELLTRECVELAKARLFQGGMLAVVVESQGWNDALVRSLGATLATSFPHVLALPTAEPPDALGSTILLASDRALEIPDESIPEPLMHIADPLEHWNAIQTSHAWANAFEPDVRGVAVLTDDRNPAEIWGDRINLAARRELHRFFRGAAEDSLNRIRDPSW
jgi:spermidine synthase